MTDQTAGKMRYHSKLFYRALSESSVDGDGNYLPQSADLIFACYCRDESNSSGRKVSNGEGSHIEYSSLIYAPDDCPDLKPADYIEVSDNSGTKRVTGTVLRFSRDRYNCRIWV